MGEGDKLPCNSPPSTRLLVKVRREDLVALASPAVAVNQRCTFASSSRPTIRPLSTLLTKAPLQHNTHWSQEDANRYEKDLQAMRPVTCSGQEKAKLESQPAAIFRSASAE